MTTAEELRTRVRVLNDLLDEALADLRMLEREEYAQAMDKVLERGPWLTQERLEAMRRMIVIERMMPHQYCPVLRAMPGPPMPSDKVVQNRARSLRIVIPVGRAAEEAPAVVPLQVQVPIPAPPKVKPFSMGAMRGADPLREARRAQKIEGARGRV